MSSPPSDLAHRRAEIDKFDREIHRLLTERAKVVYGVARAKAAATAAGVPTPPFRPGREAEVLRGLVARHQSEFPVASLLRIWREIMSGATRMQAVQHVAVAGGDPMIAALARDHFGAGAEYRVVAGVEDALPSLMRHEIAAVVLPTASVAAEGLWWQDWVTRGEDGGVPHIVARLPFFHAGMNGDAMVLSAFAADESSDDIGVFGLSLASGASAEAAAAAVGAGLQGAPQVAGRAALIEVGGTEETLAAALAALRAAPGVDAVRQLGIYARPLAPNQTER